MSEISDFRCGSVWGSVNAVGITFVLYILIPLIIMYMISSLGESIGASADMDLTIFTDEINKYLIRLALYSIPLLFISLFKGYYAPGNRARIPFKVVYSLYVALMLLLVTNFGNFTAAVDMSSIIDGMGDVSVVLNVGMLIYILAAISAAKAPLAFTEYIDKRKEYQETKLEKYGNKE